ncbi:MAG TPA: NmrA family transcriptional regulator [Chloroflexota bacterium]|jgi:uncharacterized protein YbjT (DUF2867 family)
MEQHTHGSILVLGGTGKTGRRVAERLRERGRVVRIGSRSGEIPFDWDRPVTWEPALRGIKAAYLTYYPDLAVPGAAESVGALAQLAVQNGIQRLVLLSGRGGEPEALRAEQAVQAAGAHWTVVRCSWFSQNFSEGYLLEPVLSGEVALPVDGVPEPFVDAEDIADVAVAALTGDGHSERVYELTGPRTLRFAEAVEEIADASGRPLRFVPVTMDDYVAGLEQAEVPDNVIAVLRYLFSEVLDGRNARPDDGVQRALGRQPRDFRDFARRTAASGVWRPAPAGIA